MLTFAPFVLPFFVISSASLIGYDTLKYTVRLAIFSGILKQMKWKNRATKNRLTPIGA